MNVKQSLAYPLNLQRLSTEVIESRLATWTKRLRIPPEWLERSSSELSLGQRQLVCIARALVLQPQVLLLDEPTSALDEGNTHYLIKLLRQLAQNEGISMIMVNHQLDLVQEWADQVIVLNQGRIQAMKPSAQTNWEELRSSLKQTSEDQSQEAF